MATSIKGPLLVTLFCLIGLINADIYMHNPRGSNDRLNAEDAQRQNANRLFDSQNNAKGGYNVGETTSQRGAGDGEDTYLPIEWTDQHSCGTNELTCTLVLQMLCQPDVKVTSPDWEIRDGQNEGTISFSQPNSAENEDQKNNRKRNDLSQPQGVHEPWDWYNECYQRERNRNLFTAERNLNSVWLNNAQVSTAIYTRQNNNGARHGYECPEERDYYPYFGPTPWKDVAVLTDNTSTLCQYYKANSFSGSTSRGICAGADGNRIQAQYRHNNASACTASGYTWLQVYNYLEKAPGYSSESACKAASDGKTTYLWAVPWDAKNFLKKECLVQLATPDCVEAPWGRANHNGNSKSTGDAPRYQWTIPYFPSGQTQRCVLRIRYNITSMDFDAFKTDAKKNQPKTEDIRNYYLQLFQTRSQEIRDSKTLNWTQKNDEVTKLEAKLKVEANNKLNEIVTPIRTNPKIAIADGFPQVQFATNADQMGRVFQDRSHVFRLAARPSSAAGKKIYNLNVRGKRGNIVQAYPAVEYDFIPNSLQISRDSLVHIQWTGSNRAVGDGEGRQGTDRSNMVQMATNGVNYPLISPNSTLSMWSGASVVWTPFQSLDKFPFLSATSRSLSVFRAEQSLQENAYQKLDSSHELLNRNKNNTVDRSPILSLSANNNNNKKRSDDEDGNQEQDERVRTSPSSRHIHRVRLEEQVEERRRRRRRAAENVRVYQAIDLAVDESEMARRRKADDEKRQQDERNVELWDWSESPQIKSNVQRRADSDYDEDNENYEPITRRPNLGSGRGLAVNAKALSKPIGPEGLTDENLALALLTSGYYWCLSGSTCPSYIPKMFVAPPTITENNLNPTLDQASPTFAGVLLSFNPGTYYYSCTRNNKFSNRSQKGRIVVN